MVKAEILRELGTSCICDAMVSLGLGVRSLNNDINALNVDLNFCYGPAFTIKGAENGTHEDKLRGLGIMNYIPKDSVILIDINGGENVGHWGELMSTAAISKGAKGVVLNGGCRDKAQVNDLKFAVFCKYTTPCEALSLYYMGEYNVALEMSNSLGDKIKIFPKDIIVADLDGVVIIPSSLEEEVIEKAKLIRKNELITKELLTQGKDVREVFSSMNVA